jgi:hypothetical protein
LISNPIHILNQEYDGISYFIKCTPMRFPCFKAYFLEATSQITSRGYFEQIVSFLMQFSLTKVSSDNRYNFATLRRHRGVFFFSFWTVLYTTCAQHCAEWLVYKNAPVWRLHCHSSIVTWHMKIKDCPGYTTGSSLLKINTALNGTNNSEG